MDLEKLKELHDKAYDHGQGTREEAADDLVFYYADQWGDYYQESELLFRGQFDLLKKAGRQVIADLAENPVQVDFEPKDSNRDDAAEILDGIYRTDIHKNTTLAAYEVGTNEAAFCGFGAWMLYTEYETLRGENRNQVIKWKPIPEANNTVYFDPNATMIDKSDAKYCSVLTRYTEDGYKELVKELTGEEIEEVDSGSFKDPEKAYAFQWYSEGGRKIYVTKFFWREKVKTKAYDLIDPFGVEMTMKADDLDKVMDEMIDSGFEIVSEKEQERYQVTKYIASGERILSEDIIAGEHIPVIPVYGEYAYVDGELHYEGIVRPAKDPQRLRNFAMSYVGDIMSKSPRSKPIYWPDQIKGFEHMYDGETDYPFLYMNRKAADGTDLPLGPAGMTPDQPIPQSLAAVIDLTRQSVEDVANAGLPAEMSDPSVQIAHKTVAAMQKRIDMQSFIYQQHLQFAKRREGDIYASMASEIYDVPRKVTATLPDGTRKEVEMMQTVIDEQTGDMVTLNDINNQEFNVYSTIGPSYSSQKEQTIEQMQLMIQGMQQGDPVRRALELKVLTLIDGVEFDDIKKYANKELVMSGFKEPETDEEKQMVAQAQQQPKQPEADMVLAQAEMLKGQADMAREQRENQKMQLEFQNKNTEAQIDTYNAQTSRMKVEVDAQKAGADIRNKNVDTFGKQVDTQIKIQDASLRRLSAERGMYEQQ